MPLREAFPDMPFVGMEPAVKPAARDTQTGVIGVIATAATFQGELYASVVGRFAQGVQVETLACPEFVTLAEAGETDTPRARAIVHECLAPLLAAGIDQLVLGCTHFPFLKDGDPGGDRAGRDAGRSESGSGTAGRARAG